MQIIKQRKQEEVISQQIIRPLHPGLDNQYTLVFTLFMIGCLDVIDTQWLNIIGQGANRGRPSLAH